MALFGSPKPVVLKEGSAAEEQLRQMEDAKGTLGPRAEARLEKDLRLVRAGIDGERRILYELKNSHMDMFILQDLSLEYEGPMAQNHPPTTGMPDAMSRPRSFVPTSSSKRSSESTTRKARVATRRFAPLPKIVLNGSWPSTSQGRLITSQNIGKSQRPSKRPHAQNPRPRTTLIRSP